MDLALNTSFAKAQQLNGVSLSSFIASISISVIIFTMEIVVFLVIRSHLPDIYSLGSVVSSSTSTAWRITRCLQFELNDGHLDRYFFRRYIRTLFFLFFPAGLLITPVLIPLNYLHGKTATLGVSGLDALGWSNVGLDHCDRYWAHLVMGVLFVSYVCWVIWIELAHYVEIRQKSPCLALRTVLIDAIPEDWMSKEGLVSQLEAFPGKVTAISFNRDFRVLSQATEKRERLARSLEMAETRYIRRTVKAGIQKSIIKTDPHENSIRPSPISRKSQGLVAWFIKRAEPIAYYRNELRKVTKQVENDRMAPEKFTLLNSAFVTFDNPLAAHMVCQTVIHTKPGYMTPRILPISAEDIVWSNVCIPWWSRYIRTVVSNVLITGAAMICVVPAAFTGLLSQIIYLTQAVEWLSWINDIPEWSLGLIQGVLPPVLLAILVKGFAAVLEYLIRKQGISTKSKVDLKIQEFYFYFLFFQTTLVVSLSAGVTTIANEMAEGGSLVETLAKNLPKASNYFLSYVLLQALSISASSLLRIDRLGGKFVLAPIFDRTVTHMIMREKGQDIQWGTFIPFYTNLCCIGFLYAIISPIILPIQTFAFALFWLIYSKSTLLHTERDNGGLFYPRALKHLVVGLYLMEVSLVGLFLLVRDSHGEAMCIGQACVMTAAIALTAVYHRLLHREFHSLLGFAPTAAMSILAKERSSSPSFHHKALKLPPVVRLPCDERGISSVEAFQIREELPGVVVLEDQATMCSSGRIRLRTALRNLESVDGVKE